MWKFISVFLAGLFLVQCTGGYEDFQGKTFKVVRAEFADEQVENYFKKELGEFGSQLNDLFKVTGGKYAAKEKAKKIKYIKFTENQIYALDEDLRIVDTLARNYLIKEELGEIGSTMELLKEVETAYVLLEEGKDFDLIMAEINPKNKIWEFHSFGLIFTLKETEDKQQRPPLAYVMRTTQNPEEFVQGVLTLLAKKKYLELTEYMHPQKCAFMPAANAPEYSIVDTKKFKKFLRKWGAGYSKLNWGSRLQPHFHEGEVMYHSEEPVIMKISEYFDKFVYDQDYRKLKCEKGIVQKMPGEKLKENFPNAMFFSCYDPKKDLKEQGTLILAIEKVDGRFYVSGFIHSEYQEEGITSPKDVGL